MKIFLVFGSYSEVAILFRVPRKPVFSKTHGMFRILWHKHFSYHISLHIVAYSPFATYTGSVRGCYSLHEQNFNDVFVFYICWCREGNTELINYLLTKDAKAWQTSSRNGRTPLHTAGIIIMLIISCGWSDLSMSMLCMLMLKLKHLLYVRTELRMSLARCLCKWFYQRSFSQYLYLHIQLRSHHRF